jgi:hypothetical protein
LYVEKKLTACTLCIGTARRVWKRLCIAVNAGIISLRVTGAVIWGIILTLTDTAVSGKELRRLQIMKNRVHETACCDCKLYEDGFCRKRFLIDSTGKREYASVSLDDSCYAGGGRIKRKDSICWKCKNVSHKSCSWSADFIIPDSAKAQSEGNIPTGYGSMPLRIVECPEFSPENKEV